MTPAGKPRLMLTLSDHTMGGNLRVPLERYLHFCTDLAVDLETLEDDLAARRLSYRRSGRLPGFPAGKPSNRENRRR